MAKIEQLFNYPVAGMKGFEVESLTLTPESIVGNRSFAVVLESEIEQFLADNNYIPLRATQTGLPELVLLLASVEDDELNISQGDEAYQTKVNNSVEESPKPFIDQNNHESDITTTLAEYALPMRVARRSTSKRWAIDCGDDVAQWLSGKLRKKVRLMKAVKHPETQKHHFTWYTAMHLITQSSLMALANETDTSVDFKRMRANAVASETMAWEEELWKTVNLGGIEAVATLCERCGYLGIDQETGKKATKMEILDVISRQHELNFGVYIQPNRTLTVSVGDVVEIMEKS